MLLRNRLYIGIIDVPEFGVRDQRGDFEPLIGEAIFYKAQAVLSGKVPVIAPLLKRRPDFPLRGFVRCAECDAQVARFAVTRKLTNRNVAARIHGLIPTSDSSRIGLPALRPKTR